MDADDHEPAAAEIEKIASALRSAIKEQYETDSSLVTVGFIRARVETELGLGSGYFNDSKYWKPISKKLIKEEAEEQNALLESPPAKKAVAPPKKKTPAKKPAAKKSTKKPTKAESEEDGDVVGSDAEDEPPKKGRRAAPKKQAPKKAKASPVKDTTEEHDPPEPKPEPSESELSEVPDETPKKTTKRPRSLTKGSDASGTKKTKISPEIPGKKPEEEGPGLDLLVETNHNEEGGSSDSEMSVVLDPTPEKKAPRNAPGGTAAVRKKVPKPTTKKSKSRAKKATAKEEVSLSPDEEQIKSLQGWLLKCGIRKIWSRELKKFDTSKEKISHLRGILTDIGMTGRYSADKARKIKDERELQAELKAIQAGAAEWGDEADDKKNTRASRNAPVAKPDGGKKEIRGLEDLAWLDDQTDSD